MWHLWNPWHFSVRSASLSPYPLVNSGKCHVFLGSTANPESHSTGFLLFVAPSYQGVAGNEWQFKIFLVQLAWMCSCLSGFMLNVVLYFLYFTCLHDCQGWVGEMCVSGAMAVNLSLGDLPGHYKRHFWRNPSRCGADFCPMHRYSMVECVISVLLCPRAKQVGGTVSSTWRHAFDCVYLMCQVPCFDFGAVQGERDKRQVSCAEKDTLKGRSYLLLQLRHPCWRL